MSQLSSQLHLLEKECALADSHIGSLFYQSQMLLRFRGVQSRDPQPTAPPTISLPSHPSLPERPSPSLPGPPPSLAHTISPAYEIWRASRDGTPSSHRPITLRNLALALQAVRYSSVELFVLLWGVNPVRMTILLFLNLIRGTLPALRCYSQALLLDEAQTAVARRAISERLAWLLALEVLRMLGERLFDHFATQNENLVQQNVRFRVEYLQMETQLRLDIPSLSDPEVLDLLGEADAFSRSFSGMGGLGLLSPFDLIRTLTTITSELISQLYILWTLIMASHDGSHHVWSLNSTQLLILASALFPTLLSIVNSFWMKFYNRFMDEAWTSSLYNREEAAASQQHERMRRLAYDESFKSEIMVFGLADWILRTWAETRAVVAGMKEKPKRNVELVTGFVDSSTRELFSTLQAIPLILQLSTASLGSVTLYRSTTQTIIAALKSLHNTFQMTFQGVFLMAAFHAALSLRPVMEPKKEDTVLYETMKTGNGKQGMKIEARNLSFTYPGQVEPSISNLNLVIQPGETVAIVGHNGGGKTTLMHLLLRLYEHDGNGGQLLINDVDARKYSAADLHSHSSAVFQGFSKLTNASVRENTGVGDVAHMDDDERVQQALKDAGAWEMIDRSMPFGLETKLDAGGFSSSISRSASTAATPTTGMMLSDPRFFRRRHDAGGDAWERGSGAGKASNPSERVALSGGQWQRIAISRSFMRPDADLLILDEASSQLDAHAQNDIFSNIAKDAGKKTVIYITHRLSTVRWADKVAFFDKGTITEFGTHDELMRQEGSYASLYHAFMATGA